MVFLKCLDLRKKNRSQRAFTRSGQSAGPRGVGHGGNGRTAVQAHIDARHRMCNNPDREHVPATPQVCVHKRSCDSDHCSQTARPRPEPTTLLWSVKHSFSCSRQKGRPLCGGKDKHAKHEKTRSRTCSMRPSCASTK